MIMTYKQLKQKLVDCKYPKPFVCDQIMITIAMKAKIIVVDEL